MKPGIKQRDQAKASLRAVPGGLVRDMMQQPGIVSETMTLSLEIMKMQ